jgi:pyruvate/2-oxoglutarate dehydrogenase complex dihydrolipoamide acyltransferase (E2) component
MRSFKTSLNRKLPVYKFDAVKKPVVAGKKIEIREMVNITAVFNHDIIDGAPAARFINRLRTIIEKEYEEID